jgi:topoisomerase-4 subunit B
MAHKPRTYEAKDIETLTDIQSVQQRTEMYVGSTDAFAKWICLKEPIDNARDEAGDGHADVVYVERLGLNEFIVYDNGRGIPVDNHAKAKVPAIQLVFCKLHAGAKMNNSADAVYKKTIGVHGVGACVSNALSISLKAYTYRKGWHLLECVKGEPEKLVKQIPPLTEIAHKYVQKNKGTLVHFTLDAARFEGEIEDDTIINYLAIMSDFYPKISFVYADDKGIEVFRNDKTLAAKTALDNGVAAKQVLSLQTETLDVALCFSRKNPIKNGLHVCGSPTPEGGTHWNGLVKAVEFAIAPYVKKEAFDAEDIAESLSGVLNISLHTPRFKGQTKQRLESKEAMPIVRDALKAPLTLFFSKNKESVIEAIKHAEVLHNLALKQKRETELVKAVASTKGKLNLPPRLSQALNCRPEKRELFLVEGDSANGVAKLARIKEFQETLPLTGKILNVVHNDNRAAENAAVQDILRAVGYSKDDPNMTQARVQGKVIFLTDADSDGGHIQLLLLGFFQKYMPQALKRGMIYLVDIPLYSYRSATEQAYGNSLGEIKAQVKSFNPSYLSRAKGWGECSPAHLRALAFADTRKLIRIEAPEPEDKEVFYGLLTGDSTLRRKMLSYDPTAPKPVKSKLAALRKTIRRFRLRGK